MKKISEILCCIPNDKWTKYKFQLKNNIIKMPKPEISVHLQNMFGCLKNLMAHLEFMYNQTYELSYIFNESENQVYNEMHTSKW